MTRTPKPRMCDFGSKSQRIQEWAKVNAKKTFIVSDGKDLADTFDWIAGQAGVSVGFLIEYCGLDRTRFWRYRAGMNPEPSTLQKLSEDVGVKFTFEKP